MTMRAKSKPVVAMTFLTIVTCALLVYYGGPARAADSETLNAPFDLETAFKASGFMGDGEVAGSVQVQRVPAAVKPRDGSTSSLRLKITYRLKKEWAGVYWQYPANNWGDMPGKRIQHASKITFFAVGEKGGEVVEFKAGGIKRKDKKYKDSFEASTGPQPLTTKWQRFEIPLKDKDLSSVLGAFAWIAAASDNPSGVTFYLDSIRYE